MLKVMQILSDTNIGGAGIWLSNFDKSYHRDQIELVVVLPRGAALRPLIQNARVIECDMAPDVSLDNNSTEVLKEIIKRERPDVVHTHGSLSGRLAARNAKVGALVVYTKHTLSEPVSGMKKLVHRLVDNYTCDVAIACSECAKKNLIQNGLSEKKITVIYNGCRTPAELTEEKKAELRKRCGVSKEDFVFVIVARLAPVKDHATFLRAAAAAKLERAKFLIVGGGTLEEELQATADKLGIAEQCIFTGQLPGAEQMYQIADVNCLSSVSENMPISLLEAMSAGLPSILSRVGGMEEVAVSGETALFFESGDDEQMAAHMRTLYSDRELARAMGRAGKARYKECFTLEKSTAEVEKIYMQRGKESED